MALTKSLCRACLTSKPTFTYFIFENVCPDTYYFCTSIQVSKDEKLPRNVCSACYDLLMKYSEFKKTCLQSQATLIEQNDLKHENDLKYEVDLKYENDLKFENDLEIDVIQRPVIVNVKTEILENNVKVENEGTDHDYIDEPYHENSELNTSVVKRKVKKLVKLKKLSGKGIKVKVRKKFLYSCDVCQRKFNFKERFEAHKLEHEGKVVSIRCTPCNKTFVTWSGLKRHTESEHTQVNLASLGCTICGKIFKSQQTLKMHKKMHENRRLIICDVCGKGCSTAVTLRTHMETHKENRERPFTCEHCGKKFFTNTILLTHVSRQHSGRRFICQICSYPFTDKNNLAKHLLIHDGKKLYKCKICGKCYATHSTLTEHKRLHSGERPYLCNFCPKAFISKKRLNDHERIHTGDKPHKCLICDQRFTQRGTLNRHMKVHERAVLINN